MRHGLLRPPLAAAVFSILLSASTLGAAATGGNDFYTLRVEADPNGFGLGLYTVATGPVHPVTGALGAKDILFGGTVAPGQSYTTIRSYTSGTDYMQNAGVWLLPTAPPTFVLQSFVAPGEEAMPLGDPNDPSGFRTVYRIGDVSAAPDSLLVVQSVQAVGATFNDSAVKIETEITNTGSSGVELGVRYLWDFRIGFDDGPTYQPLNPDGAVETTETTTLGPVFETYEIVDNNPGSSCFTSVNPTVPFFAVQGSVDGPAALSPTPPTRLDFAAWPLVSGLPGLVSSAVAQPSAFDYTGSGTDSTTCDISLDDSAMIYWWGDEPSTALFLPPGATVTLAAYIFGYLPGAPPVFTPPPGDEGPFGDPTCEDGVDNDQDGLTDGDDPDCAPPNEPPDCTGAGPTIEELWPPNHKLRSVRIDGVVDPDGDDVSITVMGIYQDEPINGKGDGNTCPDAGGVGGDLAMLRSERSGKRDGRVYYIFFDADDGRGGSCSGTVSVCVPHDQGKNKDQCVDQGPIFDSTGPCSATTEDCLTRDERFYGADADGRSVMTWGSGESLKLHPQDPLQTIFPDGTLLPVQLGQGAYHFGDVTDIAGLDVQGADDGGFLPWNGKQKKLTPGARNQLPAETLTLALNTGLSFLQADSLSVADLDGDGMPEALRFRPAFAGLVVDWPGNFGDLLSVEEVLSLADAALAAGAGDAKPKDSLSDFVTVPVPAVQVAGNGKGKGKKGGASVKVKDLIRLVKKVNAACNFPTSKPSGLLRRP